VPIFVVLLNIPLGFVAKRRRKEKYDKWDGFLHKWLYAADRGEAHVYKTVQAGPFSSLVMGDVVGPPVRNIGHIGKFVPWVKDALDKYSGEDKENYQRELDKMSQEAEAVTKAQERHESWARLRRVVVLMSIILYLASRLILIAVAFANFRSAPRGIYQGTWAGFLPGVGSN
jgi:hypothetical protein